MTSLKDSGMLDLDLPSIDKSVPESCLRCSFSPNMERCQSAEEALIRIAEFNKDNSQVFDNLPIQGEMDMMGLKSGSEADGGEEDLGMTDEQDDDKDKDEKEDDVPKQAANAPHNTSTDPSSLGPDESQDEKEPEVEEEGMVSVPVSTWTFIHCRSVQSTWRSQQSSRRSRFCPRI
jgi:hypothetical protein